MRDANRLTARNIFQRKMFTESQNRSVGTHRLTARNIFQRKMFTGSQNRSISKSAFTLIEVMVSVMIISVVIAALLQMRGNGTFLFLNMNKKAKINQYTSFFIANENYGYENKSTSLDELVSEFDLENNLRRKLRDENIKIIYQKLKIIDMNDFAGQSSDNVTQAQAGAAASAMVFEIGKTVLKTKDSSVALVRLRRQ